MEIFWIYVGLAFGVTALWQRARLKLRYARSGRSGRSGALRAPPFPPLRLSRALCHSAVTPNASPT